MRPRSPANLSRSASEARSRRARPLARAGVHGLAGRMPCRPARRSGSLQCPIQTGVARGSRPKSAKGREESRSAPNARSRISTKPDPRWHRPSAVRGPPLRPRGRLPAMPPLIGISLSLDASGRFRRGRRYHYIDERYADAVTEAGGVPAYLPIQPANSRRLHRSDRRPVDSRRRRPPPRGALPGGGSLPGDAFRSSRFRSRASWPERSPAASRSSASATGCRFWPSTTAAHSSTTSHSTCPKPTRTPALGGRRAATPFGWSREPFSKR